MLKNKFKKTLQAAVLLSCATLFPWQAMAEEVEYEVYEQEFFYKNDIKPYFTAEIVDVGQKTEDGTTRDIEDEEFDAIQEQAIAYLGDITGAPVKAYPIINLTPLDIKDANASASSEPLRDGSGLTEYASYFINSGISTGSEESAAQVTVNSALEGTSWYTVKYPILPVNGIDSDYAGTIVHEMVHAMGVGCFDRAEDEDNNQYIDCTSPLKFTAGLYDAFGRNVNEITKQDNYVSITPITKRQYQKLKIKSEQKGWEIPNDTFYIINDYDNVKTYGGVYFSGDNVLDVLNGAKIAWPDGSSLEAVPGIPIECFEGENLDLSHLELQNSLMSHQTYRNWCTLMEAELALLQDIGFDKIDRSKFFGKSIYASGLNYGSGVSWSSDTDRAIGLHIYGSNNEVTLNSGANITATGSYSMGIRVDGSQNDLTISSNVQVGSDGSTTNEPTEDSYGLSVNYGKGHNVTINSGASVIANGKGSIGAIFDFGSNELGDRTEYRGSYIRGSYDEEQGEFVNIAFTEDGALKGALVDVFEVKGTLSGEKAIYISPNALVKTINIAGNDSDNTVDVSGDIISEWNPEGVEYFYTRNYDGENPYEGLKPNIQLANGETLDDYRTNLNFNGDRTFTDNIIGPYGLIMNVKSGHLTTTYAGDEEISYVNAYSVNVGDGKFLTSVANKKIEATYTVENILMANNGYGAINVFEDGKLELTGNSSNVGTILIAFNGEDDNDGISTSGIINNLGTVDFQNGELALKPDAGFYNKETTIQVMSNSKDEDKETFDRIWFVDINGEKVEAEIESDTNTKSSLNSNFVDVTNTLSMTAVQGTGANSNLVYITTERDFDDVELDEDEEVLGDVIEEVDGSIDKLEATDRDEEWEKMLGAIDFLKTDEEINNALGQLLPSAYGYGAMATMDLHRMLSDFAVGGSRCK